MSKFKLGIIGGGLIAETAHLPAIMRCSDVELTFIIEKNTERINYLKNNLGITIPIVSTIEEVTTPIDGVIICTPNNTHKDIAVKCLELGIHVLIEKPIANGIEDAILIQKTASINNLVVMTGFCTRFWPSVQYIKHLIDSKSLGKIKKFVFQYGAEGGWAPISNYISSKSSAGGGAFVINGSHYLDRMLWYFGLPDSYNYYDDSETGLEANALAEFSYNKSDKFNGIIRVSKTVKINAGCVIEFENGTIIHRDWNNPSVSVKLHNYEKNDFIAEFNDFNIETRPDMYYLQIREFISKCLNPNYIGLSDIHDSITAIKLTEDLYRIRKPLKISWYER